MARSGTAFFYTLCTANPVAARSKTRVLSSRTLDRGFETRIGQGCLPFIALRVGRGAATS
jgi:hypothetical protein